ncbi:FKBP-type peptidyl-prolyl cis-trans isomerase [Vicingaceae bacterium]|nr:FKBP-type peptidyl-prolyl cis-trans isomerase [Vicingaceae bacterium]MDC1451120.1 FKBP-type peptidyl-prolyl cis-trans isomerase [Vicingaceae bacterium]
MKKLGFRLSIIAVAMAAVSCGNKTTNQYPGYDKVEEGLYVKYYTKNKESRQAANGDILTMSMTYGTEDSTLFDTGLNGQPVQLRADSGKYVGDILTAFMNMRKGDSAAIIVNADSFFMKTAGMPSSPDFIDSAAMLYFTVGLTNIQSMEEMQSEADAKNSEAEANEMVILAKYLEDNNITTEPTESGLIFISKKKGSGKQAVSGKKVKVNYEGMFLDGKYFDTSVEEAAKANGIYNPQRPYGPFDFDLGGGQVIKGWDEGIAMMKEGGKARLIIPSKIAYGSAPRPGAPFSTLIFDVELIEVLD